MNRFRKTAILWLLMLCASAICAQQNDSGLLTLDTVFTYRAETLDAVQWQADGSGYLTLEPSSNARASNIVRYDAASGEKTIFVPAEKLVPTGSPSESVAVTPKFSARVLCAVSCCPPSPPFYC